MDISIHDKPVRVVLDTGADMSVLPRDVLLQLLPNIHLEPPTQVAQAFGGEQLLLEGPYHLMVTIVVKSCASLATRTQLNVISTCCCCTERVMFVPD